jgi:hypothetical protein
VKHGGVGVPEDGDELVSIDLSFDRAERRVAAFVCERGAHCVKETQGRGTGRAGRERTKVNALGKYAAESGERTLPCTRQTSLCTCASANFRGLMEMVDDGDVGGVDESGVGAACTAVAIGIKCMG